MNILFSYDSDSSGSSPKISFRKIVYLSLPLFILVAFLVFIFYFIESRNLVNYYSRLNQTTLSHVELALMNLFHNLKGDTKLLTEHPFLLRAIDNPSGPESEIIKKQWVSFAKEKKIYDQIRLIGINGKELIRINFNNGNVTIVKSSELQNKVNRYYFTEALKLPEGKIYFSNLDLNIENHEIELPLKPMLRVVLPVWENKIKKGVIVVNYLASQVLEDIETNGRLAEANLLLLNEDGYYLRGLSSDKEWTFMYPEKKDSGLFKNDFPWAWKSIEKNATGRVDSKNGIFHYMWFSINKNDSPKDFVRKFVLVAYLSSSHISDLLSPYRLASYIILIIALPLVLILAALYTRYQSLRMASVNNLKKAAYYQKLILESIGEGIFAIDKEGIISYTNSRASNILNIPKKAIVGSHIHDMVHLYNPDTDHARDNCSFLENIQSLGFRASGEDLFYRSNGNLLPVLYTTRPVRTRKKIIGAVLSFADISDQKKAKEQTERLAFFDPLTDLPNKNSFISLMNPLIESLSDDNKKGCLFYINIDRFKNINDIFGHHYGDLLLKEFASRLSMILTDKLHLARVGSDEFALLDTTAYEDIDSASEDAVKFSDSILRIMELPFHIKGEPIHLTASIGMVIFPNESHDSATLLSQADTAVSRAKKSGRNTARFYQSEMKENIKNWHVIRNRLLYAINHPGSFYVVYQPKININSGMNGMEALVRWNDEELGEVSPGEFIPIAESSGLIKHITDIVLGIVSRQIKSWIEMGFENQINSVSINISPEEFIQKDFAGSLIKKLKTENIPSSMIELEITERALVEDIQRTNENLSILAENLIKFSIDDFGTGYSSLSYLQQLKIDKLKIDKSFVENVHRDKNRQSIARSIIYLAKGLSIDVIAEGVETADELDFMKENGCNEFQGYYFFKPMEADDISKIFLKGLPANLIEA